MRFVKKIMIVLTAISFVVSCQAQNKDTRGKNQIKPDLYEDSDDKTIKVSNEQKKIYTGKFIVMCKSDTDWLEQIKKGASKTSNTDVNKLINKYKLTISNYNDAHNSFDVWVDPIMGINKREIAVLFSVIDGVTMVELPVK